MEKQNLKLLRDIFFKTFVVGLLLAILLLILNITFWDKWSSFIYTHFQVAEKELGNLLVNSFLWIRTYLFFIILAPAIALHWVIKSKK